MMSVLAPARQFVPTGAVRRRDGRIWLSRDEQDVLKLPVADGVMLAVLEAFLFASEPDEAFERFASRDVAAARARLRDVEQIFDVSVDARCRLGRGALTVFLGEGRKVTLTELSRETSGVLETICANASSADDRGARVDRKCFDDALEELVGASLLSPGPGSIDFGDLKRRWPFSHRFGFDRGAPVDRYYLQQFVAAIGPKVRGRCLEIGGTLVNRGVYKLEVDEFRTLDLPHSGVADDLMGDAADPDVFAADSWDSILAFHVLEHCPDPFAVVHNIHRWLTPGGHAFIVVPCAQRMHNFPGDYWRFMPDGLRVLFKEFAEAHVSAYGNPLTVVSSFLGLSHTELPPEDMDFVHPDYPVISCVVARK
jgi:SAM-dependent methyltransferase